MATTISTVEPTRLTAGESWAWDRTLADYSPADGWTLKYALRGPFDTTLTATSADDAFQVRLAPSGSTQTKPGSYRLIGYVERGAADTLERHIVYDAALVVVASPLFGVSAPSFDEAMLAAIRDVLRGRIPADVESYEIAGRNVTKIPHAELQKWEGVYRARVAMARRGGRFGRVEVSFTHG